MSSPSQVQHARPTTHKGAKLLFYSMRSFESSITFCSRLPLTCFRVLLSPSYLAAIVMMLSSVPAQRATEQRQEQKRQKRHPEPLNLLLFITALADLLFQAGGRHGHKKSGPLTPLCSHGHGSLSEYTQELASLRKSPLGERHFPLYFIYSKARFIAGSRFAVLSCNILFWSV